MCHKKKRYTSDLTDAEWEKLLPYLPLKRQGLGRPLKIDMREAVNGMFYVLKTGCQWSNLPKDFPPYQSVYYHYRKWCQDGTWEMVNRALCYERRHAEGRPIHPSAVRMVGTFSASEQGLQGMFSKQRGHDFVGVHPTSP